MHSTRNVVVLIALAAACASGVAVSRLRAQSPAPATVTVLRFGSVWDGAKVTRNAVVVVEATA
jgi:xanthosine utilization system XapX-like protein